MDHARLKAETAGNSHHAAEDIYKHPRYDSICTGPNKATFKSAARLTKKGIFPPNYAIEITDGFRKVRPKAKDWDPCVGENFRHFTKPYWHNSHHIVPNGVLATAILEASKKDQRLSYLIKSGLLKAGYNLNARLNMIILPMEKEVAAALMLPRHLVGGEGGTNEKKEYFSHKDYSTRIADKVKAVIDEYANILTKDPPEDHDRKPSELSKAKLERISKTVYTLLLAAGSDRKGDPLSSVDV